MCENPSVNRSIPDKALDHIDHALGRPTFPLRESYRNYYAIDASSELAGRLEASLYWELRNAVEGGLVYYSVTALGRQALADWLALHGDAWRPFEVEWDGHSGIVAARSAGSAKYKRFLQASDAYCDLTFGEFVKTARVRRLPEAAHG